MKSRKIILGLTSLLMVTALSGCRPPMPPTTSNTPGTSVDGGQKVKIQFWTGFGASVFNTLGPLLTRFQEEHPNIEVEYGTKGGYPNLLQAIQQSVSNTAYPHIANGYPDHFADYSNANILLKLNTNDYINNPDPNIGVDVSEYYADYMEENTTLIDGVTSGLPFNKSTEIMIANQSFFDVAALAANDPTIKVPTTWQELETVGLKLKQVAQDKGWFGKLVQKDGTAVDKPDKPTEALLENTVVDMFNVKEAKDFIPFSWDSRSNFFITMLRQWGAEYTRRGENFQSGTIEFHRGESLEKTKAGLTFFKNLYDKKIIGLPETFGESQFSSKPFKEGRLVMTVSSSAGVKENLPDTITDYPFELSVHPILYNADNPDNKYVISQGTNLGLFRKGRATDPQTKLERAAAWKLLRYLTYEVNHEFGKGTSYFPVTDGSKLPVDENNKRYQDYKHYIDFLEATDGTSTDRAIRDTAKTQANVYQDEAQNWKKFVDAAFLGSATIRSEVEFMMGHVFSGKTPQEAIDAVVAKLGKYV